MIKNWHIPFLSLALCISCLNLRGQLVNNGAKLFVSANAVVSSNDAFVNKSGTFLHHGSLLVGTNWLNQDLQSQVFEAASTGVVKLSGTNNAVGGLAPTTFPHLLFKNGGKFNFTQNATVKIALDLNDAHLYLAHNSLALLNSNDTSLAFSKGFISMDKNGKLIRKVNQKQYYTFPVATNLGLKRFVNVSPINNDIDNVEVSMVAADPTFDGYNRSRFTNDITEINDQFYHIISVGGKNATADLSILTTVNERFNGLVSWNPALRWERIFNSAFKPNNFNIADLPNAASQKVSFFASGPKVIAFAQMNANTDLFFYNAFSPDGDGINDTWEIKNIDLYPDNELTIVDRSGNLVHRTKSYNSTKFWDGNNAKPGTYIYVLKVKIGNEEKVYKGTITMVKP